MATVSGRAFATPYGMSYGGRLTAADGTPIAGPVELQVGFFGSAAGSDSVHAPVTLPTVTLVQGVFSVDLGLSADDIQTLFGSGGDVYVQVTDVTHNKTYPRQHLSAVPYALRVPIDGKTLTFDASGNLVG